jgi:hypothetical protein
MTDHEARSTRAKALLADPLLIEALKAVSDDAYHDWAESREDQEAERVTAWHRFQAVRAVRVKLEAFAADAAVRKFNKKEPKE